MSTPARSERSIQKSITGWARQKGLVVVKLTTHGRYGTVGWPDLMILYKAPWLPLFMEVKTELGTLTALQYQKLRALRALGYPAVVVHSFDEAKAEVETWLK